ncbi:hypothetical protein G4Z16_32030 [Streptomyces bathyalis]|uniref:Uncharacterized protein n=1 Tax=Streptomyces bathyalis TaxID=2710756 RepID=A0A7T1TC93_9ACTN|nr:hypothetical protein [Streptomyces bathyalis]QPP10288.1 hypothetical protein G4Z16_32030 [Streptomyces bathyalis]
MLPSSGGPQLRCGLCGILPAPGGGVREEVLAHPARHARENPLAPHLRTCRCREPGCTWHPRRRGCDGEILLVLSRCGHAWRLADLCHGCAAVTPHTAPVAEGLGEPAASGPGPVEGVVPCGWAQVWEEDEQPWWPVL